MFGGLQVLPAIGTLQDGRAAGTADGDRARPRSGARGEGERRDALLHGRGLARGAEAPDFDAVVEMVRGVRALGMEACVTLGMLQPHRPAGSPRPASLPTTTTSIRGPIFTARSSRRARIPIASRRSTPSSPPGSRSVAAVSSAWANRGATAPRLQAKIKTLRTCQIFKHFDCRKSQRKNKATQC